MTLYAEERQLAIAQLIGDRGRVSVAEIAERFDVTTETVRRDLSALERAGLVRRVHGGAVPPAAIAALESGVSERDHANTTQKHRIVQAALALLPPPGGTVLIDAGTTTSRLVRALPTDHRLTVITHSVPVAARLAGSAQVDLHVLPGRVRPTTQAAVGADTVTALTRLRVDVCFLATNGISLTHGLSTPDYEEAAVKRAMVAASQKVICLADASKMHVESTQRFAELADIDVLVTDSGIGGDMQRSLSDAGIEVVIAQ